MGIYVVFHIECFKIRIQSSEFGVLSQGSRVTPGQMNGVESLDFKLQSLEFRIKVQGLSPGKVWN